LLANKNDDEYILKPITQRSNLIPYFSRKFIDIFPEYAGIYAPYNFRHTFATELGKNANNPYAVDFLIGKLPAGTLKNYLKKDIGIMYEMIKKLPSVLGEYKKNVAEKNICFG